MSKIKTVFWWTIGAFIVGVVFALLHIWWFEYTQNTQLGDKIDMYYLIINRLAFSTAQAAADHFYGSRYSWWGVSHHVFFKFVVVLVTGTQIGMVGGLIGYIICIFRKSN